MEILINQAAWSISKKLKQKFPEELPSLDIIRYSIKFLISNLIPIIIIIVAGILLDLLKESMVALIAFSSLRMFSGGFHFKSVELCVVFSSITILLIAFISRNLDNDYLIYLNCFSLVLTAIYSPSNITKQTRVNEKYFIVFKIISILIVASSFIFNSSVVTTSFLIQSVLLIRFLKGGDEDEKR